MWVCLFPQTSLGKKKKSLLYIKEQHLMVEPRLQASSLRHWKYAWQSNLKRAKFAML